MRRAILQDAGSKTLPTEDGEVEIAVPRDRVGSFEPQLIAKGQTHFTGFDDKILSLYARGMTMREIQGHLVVPYATDVSPDLIGRVADAVLDEVREWQNRPLDSNYPVLFFDAKQHDAQLKISCYRLVLPPPKQNTRPLFGEFGDGTE